MTERSLLFCLDETCMNDRTSLFYFMQSHCAVGEVYFALDPETGITTQANHDPWKWAQNVAEKMAESGCLIFIGAPPEHVGISIYKDLPNNQAFISTMYLKKMVRSMAVQFIRLNSK
jgi:hypothetical protein